MLMNTEYLCAEYCTDSEYVPCPPNTMLPYRRRMQHHHAGPCTDYSVLRCGLYRVQSRPFRLVGVDNVV